MCVSLPKIQTISLTFIKLRPENKTVRNWDTHSHPLYCQCSVHKRFVRMCDFETAVTLPSQWVNTRNYKTWKGRVLNLKTHTVSRNDYDNLHDCKTLQLRWPQCTLRASVLQNCHSTSRNGNGTTLLLGRECTFSIDSWTCFPFPSIHLRKLIYNSALTAFIVRPNYMTNNLYCSSYRWGETMWTAASKEPIIHLPDDMLCSSIDPRWNNIEKESIRTQ